MKFVTFSKFLINIPKKDLKEKKIFAEKELYS